MRSQKLWIVVTQTAALLGLCHAVYKKESFDIITAWFVTEMVLGWIS